MEMGVGLSWEASEMTGAMKRHGFCFGLPATVL